MARTVEYIIHIKGGKLKTEKAKPEAAVTNKGDQISPARDITKTVMKAAAYGYAKKFLGTIASANVNTVSLRTGQIQLQERQQAILGYASSAFDIVESAVAGWATTGSPYGALAGAAASLAFKGIDYGIEKRELQLSASVENIGRTQANIRAGAGGGRAGKTY